MSQAELIIQGWRQNENRGVSVTALAGDKQTLQLEEAEEERGQNFFKGIRRTNKEERRERGR